MSAPRDMDGAGRCRAPCDLRPCGLRCRRGPRGQIGAATVLACALATLLVTVSVVATTLTGAFVASHRAGVAADLAALAGAGAFQRGGGDPCLEAERIAGANGGRLQACTVDASGVTTVVAVVEMHVLRGLPFELRSAARAGPADAAGLAGDRGSVDG